MNTVKLLFLLVTGVLVVAAHRSCHNSCCAPEEKCVGFADNAQCIHRHSCVGVVCPPNKHCLVETVGEKSRAVCVAKHSCVDVTCQPDQQCKLVNGLAQCSPLSTCEGVICPSNMKCKVNKLTGQAQCQSSCTSSICPLSMRCVEHAMTTEWNVFHLENARTIMQ